MAAENCQVRVESFFARRSLPWSGALATSLRRVGTRLAGMDVKKPVCRGRLLLAGTSCSRSTPSAATRSAWSERLGFEATSSTSRPFSDSCCPDLFASKRAARTLQSHGMENLQRMRLRLRRSVWSSLVSHLKRSATPEALLQSRSPLKIRFSRHAAVRPFHPPAA